MKIDWVYVAAVVIFYAVCFLIGVGIGTVIMLLVRAVIMFGVA